MNIIRVAGVLALAFLFACSPVSLSSLAVLSQSAGVEEITGYQEWNESRTIDKNVIVNPGATLVIGKGVEIVFTSPWIGMEVEGNLLVRGTVKEPTVIRSDTIENGFTITAEMGSMVAIRNAEIRNGGAQAFLIGKTNTALAASYSGAIQVEGGTVDIQNTTFRNNLYAVIVSSSTADVRVNRSRFIDNDFDVETEGHADFRYNWWGSPGGPMETCYDYVTNGVTKQHCYYEKIYGGFDHSHPLAQEAFRDPVVIIPGILGSQEKDGELVLDPVYHTYDNLYDAFVADGYVAGANLFVFPYEWRDSNVENAALLQQKINEIKISADWPKVDIVAHSMGGLLARQYVESDSYGNDVDQLVTLATPHYGAPEAYIKWDGAAWFLSPLDLYMKHIVSQEAEENGFPDTFEYIRSRVPSVGELLPIYDYLYDVDKGGELRVYPNGYPRNGFLENLDNKSENLNKVEFDKIVGNLGNDFSTISGFNVINVDMGKYWEHGYLPGFELLSEKGIRYSNGDSTVPLYSSRSESLKSDYLIELSSDHKSMVTDAQKDVLELLTGIRPQEEVRRGLISRMLFVSVYSPIDIQVVSPSGLKVGKDFGTGAILNEIPGAYYTGYDTENEFLTIPNPEKGKYRILTQGTGEGGSYRIEATSIVEGEDGTASESTVKTEGIADPNEEGEMMIEVDEAGGVIEETAADTIAPTISISSPEDGKTYQNDETVLVAYSAEDETTAKENLAVSVSLDGESYAKSDIDLSLLPLGAHALKVTAADETGNAGEASVNFTIETSWDALLKNIDHYAALKLFKNKGEARMLRTQIAHLRQTAEFLEKYDAFFRWHPGLRSIFEREIERRLSALEKYVKHRSGKSIDPSAADRLVESMEALKRSV